MIPERSHYENYMFKGKTLIIDEPAQRVWIPCFPNKLEITETVLHEWDGCVCKKCGKIRDEEHEWEGPPSNLVCKKCRAYKKQLDPF